MRMHVSDSIQGGSAYRVSKLMFGITAWKAKAAPPLAGFLVGHHEHEKEIVCCFRDLRTRAPEPP